MILCHSIVRISNEKWRIKRFIATITIAYVVASSGSLLKVIATDIKLLLPYVSLIPINATSFPPSEGPIEDASCHIEDLEQANDLQLYTILHEIRQTAFFRTFVVNLDQKCPLQSWRVKSTTTAKSVSEESKESSLLVNPKENIQGQHEESNMEGRSNESLEKHQEEEEVDEYQCSGGAEELDDDAEPLCSITGGNEESDALFSSFTSHSQSSVSEFSPASKLESNALYHLLKDGYESKSQKDAFSWTHSTNEVVVSSDTAEDPSCEEGIVGRRRLLPDAFWNDMCSNLQAGITSDDYSEVHNTKNSKVVNLLLNPERNTGYNGTHIWRAIYEENCITVDDDDSHMCLEERVLYRLLSGLHTSTTISIAMNYYPPSKRKNRMEWAPDPNYFMSKFEQNPGHIRNLHFSYAVLLRALHKASPFLYEFSSKRKSINTGNALDDEKALVLLRRLLDSSILKSCFNVFTAFDESLMFQEAKSSAKSSSDDDNIDFDVVSLQRNFKGVFHNVSSILDCVQCQQCKLHGKLTMLGYGTALKILFMDNPVLSRNEIVAFINTIGKFSESIRDVRYLTQLYWLQQRQNELHSVQSTLALEDGRSLPGTSTTTVPSTEPKLSSNLPNLHLKSNSETNDLLSLDIVDVAIGLIASLSRQNHLSFNREKELIEMAFQRNPELLLLAKHYSYDAMKFFQLLNAIKKDASIAIFKTQPIEPDAIVVGSGLAGLAATLTILDRGGHVVLLEKEHLLGGNSNKASSGINACCPTNTSSPTDSTATFELDTLKSAGESARPDLVQTLVNNSARAVEWLRSRVGVDLSLTSQLGGHSDKRTHRPKNGMVGAEIIYGIQKAVKAYEKSGQVKIILDAKVTKLLTKENAASSAVIGVEYVQTISGEVEKTNLTAPNVILATGGFASDRSPGSYLSTYRPELVRMPTTAGSFSTGDGITLATNIGAGIIDMDKVQVHPTGWVDPADPNSTSKTLAAELMRGVGGILLNKEGERFCNELGTRSYVTEKMLAHDASYAKTGKWNVTSPIPTFSMILSSSAAAGGTKRHVDLYTRKGLMKRLEGVSELAKWMGLPKETVAASLKKYQDDAIKGTDAFGKVTFPNVFSKDLNSETFYAGTVTPVLHYCMGGVTIDKEGNVLNGETGEIIPGLHAAGEVSGGVHGVNRLAGNSLLECTVFGTIVGRKIPIAQRQKTESIESAEKAENQGSMRKITVAELQKHNTPQDCWVAIHGIVYDLTQFADEHPAGAESIHELAGTDGTSAFDAVHNTGMLEDFKDEVKGILSKD